MENVVRHRLPVQWGFFDHFLDIKIIRISKLAKYFRTKIKEAGLPFEVISNSLSNAVTPLSPANGKSAYDIFATLKDEYNIWICPNGGALSDKVFRIGHIGALTEKDIDILLNAFLDMQKRGVL